MQAATPGLELVRGVRRHIRGVLEADGIERGVIGVDVAGILAAATTGEHDLDLLPEARRVADIIRVDDAAAEQPDVRKLVEVLQRDDLGLHSAHREAGHGPIRLIRERAEVGVDVRNQFAHQHLLEHRRRAGEGIRPATKRPAAGSVCRGRRHSRVCVRASCGPAACAWTRAFIRQPIGHHDDEGLALRLGDQVVHDQVGSALVPPRILVLAPAMLEIKHRVAFGGVLVVIRRRVNVGDAREDGVGELRREEHLLHPSVRNFLERVEILVVRGDFNPAFPTRRAVEVQRAGIVERPAVHCEVIIVKTFIHRL